MKNVAIEKSIINNYSKIHEYMGTSKITKVPVDWFDWKIDQFGSVNYKDSIQLSINEDKVKIGKKPFFWSKDSVLYETNKALEHLKSTYERLFFYDKDAKFTIKLYSPEQIENLKDTANRVSVERNAAELAKQENNAQKQAEKPNTQESKFMQFICRGLKNFISIFNKQ